MSPETDYTRQRTVAELLAEHGGAPGGRRSRRVDGPQRPVPPAGPPPPGRGAPPPPPLDGRRYPAPEQAVPDRSVLREPVPREPGPRDPMSPARRPAPAAGAPPAPGRRDRPTEMIGDRRAQPGPAGPTAFRDPASRPSPPRTAPPPNGRVGGPANGSGAVRATPPMNGSAPVRAVPPAPASPGPAREAPRSTPPGNGSGRLRTVGPGREQPGPPDAQRNGPAYGAAREGSAWPPRGPQGRAVPDPGPSTGAYNPFAFDDDDDEVGPATVVGSSDTRRRPAAAPRRDPAPSRPDASRSDGPPTRFDVTGRTGDGPPTVFDGLGRRGDVPAPSARVDAARRPDSAPRPVEASGRRAPAPRFEPVRDDGGPATEVDRGPRGRATAFDGAGRRGDSGPATEVDSGRARTSGSGGHRAPGRSGFGLGLRTGRSGRTGATPATAFTGPPPGPPARAFPARAPQAPPVRPPVDQPTALTRETIDGRTEVAPHRRPPARVGDPDHDGLLHRDDELDHDDADDRDLDDRDLDGLDDDHDVDDRLHDPDLDDADDARYADEFDDHDRSDDDLDLEALADPDHDLDELDEPRPARVWAGVVAQWLAGAVAGAVLWVLFRYLWRGLPVVALAAALLVTAGLVLLVRQLLHDVDRRTTGFAVLVGLLLTASPAVLVLLGR